MLKYINVLSCSLSDDSSYEICITIDTPFLSVHTIEIISSGCDDPPSNGNACEKSIGRISVDGDSLSPDKLGFNIVVLDYPSFAMKFTKSFATNMETSESHRMARFLLNLQGSNIILVASKGDGAGALLQEGWDALVSR